MNGRDNAAAVDRVASGSPARSRRITAVVVTYQSARTLGACMKALKQSFDDGLLHCIFVDNGSSDGTNRLLQEHAGWADVVQTGVNNGFGRGCNIGLARVDSQFVVFVNPDAVVEPAALVTMMRFMEEHADAGIVGPAILEGDPEGGVSMQATGQRMTPGRVLVSALPLSRFRARFHPIRPGAPGVRTGWVCGAVLMARTDLMRRLGGFDPRFFLYWEEIDVCKRAEDEGKRVYALGTAVARHVGGASSASDSGRIDGCIAKYYFESRFYYMVKHHGRLAAAAAEVGEFAILLARSVYDLARGRRVSKLRARLQTPLFSQPDRP